MTKDNILIKQTPSENEETLVFLVENAGSINKAFIPVNAKKGDLIEIHYGDDHYISNGTTMIAWIGSDTPGIRTKRTVIEDLKKSILTCELLLGEQVNSDEFYDLITEKHCECTCNNPSIDHNKTKLIGVDLDFPNQARQCSRLLVYISKCKNCAKPLTRGRSFGSFNTTNLETIKLSAVEAAKQYIDWNNIITSRTHFQK